jgi:hypothetical protein
MENRCWKPFGSQKSDAGIPSHALASFAQSRVSKQCTVITEKQKGEHRYDGAFQTSQKTATRMHERSSKSTTQTARILGLSIFQDGFQTD